jgi:NAD(P)-dependent dehydrogenase (short-subunit alcohol dehydrogenase family)
MHPIQDTEQKPLRTGFGPTTTAREVAAGVNLDGKTAVVTGGSSGIGPETARVLAEAGAQVSANSLFAVELDRRGRKQGVRAFAVHPGGILTELARHMTDDELAADGIVREGDKLRPPATGFKTVAQGAATSVWCAVSPTQDGRGGGYCEDCDIAAAVPGDSKDLRGVRPWAIDKAVARALWDLSERLTGLRWPS